MSVLPDATVVLLALPLAAAALLAVLPSYRLSAALNVAAAFAAFLASASLFVVAPPPNAYILIDDLNVVFIVLNTFVGFTASVFSAGPPGATNSPFGVVATRMPPAIQGK